MRNAKGLDFTQPAAHNPATRTRINSIYSAPYVLIIFPSSNYKSLCDDVMFKSRRKLFRLNVKQSSRMESSGSLWSSKLRVQSSTGTRQLSRDWRRYDFSGVGIYLISYELMLCNWFFVWGISSYFIFWCIFYLDIWFAANLICLI